MNHKNANLKILNENYFKQIDTISNVSNDLSTQFPGHMEIGIEKSRLKFLTKISFALAGMPYQMTFCAISIFTQIFLLETAELPPQKVLYIIFISRLKKKKKKIIFLQMVAQFLFIHIE